MLEEREQEPYTVIRICRRNEKTNQRLPLMAHVRRSALRINLEV